MAVRTAPKPSLDLGRLVSDGLTRLPIESGEDLIEVAGRLGVLLQHDIVVARESRGRGDNSLSGRHGLAALPPHTDGAASPIPPRWVALLCREGSDTKTLLYDTKPVVERAADAAALRHLWVVKPGGGKRPFYAPVLQLTRGGWWVRFNTACMSPVSSDGNAVLRLITGPLIEHRWKAGEAIVFDNWRFLHARAAVRSGEQRRLERLVIR